MVTIKDIETALILFQQNAAKQAEAKESGDYKTANKCFSEIDQLYFLQLFEQIDIMQEFTEDELSIIF